MERIKVLYIISLLGKRGGAEKNVYELARKLDPKKFIPYVVGLKGKELIEDLKSNGIYADVVGVEKILSLNAVKKGWELFKFLKKEKIRVVVTYHHDADIWGGITAKLAGVPVIISNRRDLGYQFEKKHVWFYRIYNRFFTRITAVSEAVKNEIVKHQWTNPDKIATIYNGVQSEDYQYNGSKEDIRALRKSLGITPHEKVIGMLGAFRPVKGHLYLVKAIQEVIRSHKNFKVIMAGYNKTDYFQEVSRLTDKLGLSKYFIIPGDVDNIPEFLSIFDIFVLPSLSEGMSNALLEAMSAGKPVIATDTGGNPEVVVHNKTGFLVPPGDSHALATALHELLNGENFCKAMGHAGLIRVENDFSLNKMITRNEELYEFLLSATGKINAGILKENYFQKIKKIIKMTLSYVLYYSGITGIMRKKTAAQPRVLAYHSIDNISFKSLEIEQETHNFREQMPYLKTHHRILSLSDFLKYRTNGGQYPDNSVLITFDDGYRDNYLNAFPVLIKYNIPAVVFLTTEPIETDNPLFFDALRFGLMNTSRLKLDLQDICLRKYFLDKKNKTHIAGIIREIMNFSKKMDYASKTRLIRTIYDRLDLEWAEGKNKKIYLSWDEIREMSKSNIEFGSHTVTHPQLSALSFEECKEELIKSKQVIEDRINKPVRALAYPFGGNKDFNEMVEKAAQEAGYECAFSLCSNNYKKGSYTIGRKMVDSHMSSGFDGLFYKPLFSADMADLFHLKK